MLSDVPVKKPNITDVAKTGDREIPAAVAGIQLHPTLLRSMSLNALPTVVIGAGVAGLVAARELHRERRPVVVLDKGRGVGGRMATRRLNGAVIDHGAQFITVRHPRFAALMEEWSAAGVATEWCRGFEETPDGHPRWRGQPGMTALMKHLALGMEVRLESTVTSIRPAEGSWTLETKEGAVHRASAVILTTPVPQGLALLRAGGTHLPAAEETLLSGIQYEKCLTVLARLELPTTLPAPGARALTGGPVAWIADNQQKGISPLPAVTLQATPSFSDEWFEGDRQEAGRRMLDACAEWLPGPVIEFSVTGWRYSRPTATGLPTHLTPFTGPPLIFAGDAFGGARVEGAALSGWSAADALLAL